MNDVGNNHNVGKSALMLGICHRLSQCCRVVILSSTNVCIECLDFLDKLSLSATYETVLNKHFVIIMFFINFTTILAGCLHQPHLREALANRRQILGLRTC